ncbi:hypothetical protein ACA910_016296 [Epithemia clementina (nom. ined.)]
MSTDSTTQQQQEQGKAPQEQRMLVYMVGGAATATALPSNSIARRSMLEDMQSMYGSTRDLQQCDNSKMGRSLQKANWALETNKEIRLTIVALAITLNLAVMYGLGYIFVEYVLVARNGKPWQGRNALLAQQRAIHIPLNPNTTEWMTTDTSPTSNLDDEEFIVYLGFVVWFTCVLAGLGLELQV